MSSQPSLLFINKSRNSSSLSRSTGRERDLIYKHVQQPAPEAAVADGADAPSSRAQDQDSRPPRSKSKRFIRKRGVSANQRREDCSVGRVSLSSSNNICLESKQACTSQETLSLAFCPQSQNPPLVIHDIVLSEHIVGAFVDRETSTVWRQSGSNELTPFMWTMTLPALAGRWQLVDKSLVALSALSIGQQESDDRLMSSAWSSYGNALHSIARRLSDLVKCSSDEVICACLLLISFELFAMNPGRETWMAHINGLAQIVRLRAPSSFSSGLAHKLFLISRSKIIHGALSQRRRTFLVEGRWRTDPWVIHPKCDYEKLMDRLGQLAGLYELSDSVERITDLQNRNAGRHMFINQCYAIEASFIDWFSSLPLNVRKLAQAIPLTRFSLDESVAQTFPRNDSFDSVKTALTMMKYWAGLIEIHFLIRAANDALSFESGSSSSITEDGSCNYSPQYTEDHSSFSPMHPCDPRIASGAPRQKEEFVSTLGLQICQGVKYCMQEEFRQVARKYVTSPLSAATRAFESNLPEMSQELRWCKEVIRSLPP